MSEYQPHHWNNPGVTVQLIVTPDAYVVRYEVHEPGDEIDALGDQRLEYPRPDFDAFTMEDIVYRAVSEVMSKKR